MRQEGKNESRETQQSLPAELGVLHARRSPRSTGSRPACTGNEQEPRCPPHIDQGYTTIRRIGRRGGEVSLDNASGGRAAVRRTSRGVVSASSHLMPQPARSCSLDSAVTRLS